MARRGVELFFKMMFDDNFIHGDLHPGNMRVLGVTPDGARELSVLLDWEGSAFDIEFVSCRSLECLRPISTARPPHEVSGRH
jgi:hypothetical protein